MIRDKIPVILETGIGRDKRSKMYRGITTIAREIEVEKGKCILNTMLLLVQMDITFLCSSVFLIISPFHGCLLQVITYISTCLFQHENTHRIITMKRVMNSTEEVVTKYPATVIVLLPLRFPSHHSPRKVSEWPGVICVR